MPDEEGSQIRSIRFGNQVDHVPGGPDMKLEDPFGSRTGKGGRHMDVHGKGEGRDLFPGIEIHLRQAHREESIRQVKGFRVIGSTPVQSGLKLPDLCLQLFLLLLDTGQGIRFLLGEHRTMLPETCLILPFQFMEIKLLAGFRDALEAFPRLPGSLQFCLQLLLHPGQDRWREAFPQERQKSVSQDVQQHGLANDHDGRRIRSGVSPSEDPFVLFGSERCPANAVPEKVLPGLKDLVIFIRRFPFGKELLYMIKILLGDDGFIGIRDADLLILRQRPGAVGAGNRHLMGVEKPGAGIRLPGVWEGAVH